MTGLYVGFTARYVNGDADERLAQWKEDRFETVNYLLPLGQYTYEMEGLLWHFYQTYGETHPGPIVIHHLEAANYVLPPWEQYPWDISNDGWLSQESGAPNFQNLSHAPWNIFWPCAIFRGAGGRTVLREFSDIFPFRYYGPASALAQIDCRDDDFVVFINDANEALPKPPWEESIRRARVRLDEFAGRTANNNTVSPA